MKPFLFKILIFLFLLSLLIPSASRAVNSVKIENPLKGVNNFRDLLDKIIKLLFNLALVVAPLMIIIAGILFVTSTGKPEQIQTAKNIILYTLIGFGIILLARGFIDFFTKSLEGQ